MTPRPPAHGVEKLDLFEILARLLPVHYYFSENAVSVTPTFSSTYGLLYLRLNNVSFIVGAFPAIIIAYTLVSLTTCVLIYLYALRIQLSTTRFILKYTSLPRTVYNCRCVESWVGHYITIMRCDGSYVEKFLQRVFERTRTNSSIEAITVIS